MHHCAPYLRFADVPREAAINASSKLTSLDLNQNNSISDDAQRGWYNQRAPFRCLSTASQEGDRSAQCHNRRDRRSFCLWPSRVAPTPPDFRSWVRRSRLSLRTPCRRRSDASPRNRLLAARCGSSPCQISAADRSCRSIDLNQRVALGHFRCGIRQPLGVVRRCAMGRRRLHSVVKRTETGV